MTLLDTFKYFRLGNVFGFTFFAHKRLKSQSLKSKSSNLVRCSNVDGLSSRKLLPAKES